MLLLRRSSLYVLVGVLLLSGCQQVRVSRGTFYSNTLSFIKQVEAVKGAAMEAGGKAQRTGLITPEQGGRIRALGLKIDASEKVALDALEASLLIEGSQDKVLTAISALSLVAADLTALVREWRLQ